MELEPDERKLKPYCKYRNYINVSRSESYKGVIVPAFMEDRSEAEAMLEEHEDFYRAAAKEIFSLPMYPSLTNEEIYLVSETLHRILKCL